MRFDKLTCTNSVIFNIKFPLMNVENIEKVLFEKPAKEQSCWIGWQKNDRGNFGPKIIDMSSSMDPLKYRLH